MTTAAVAGRPSLTSIVAKRLRGVLAEEQISGYELARLTGMGRMAINRRLLGETAINTDEFEIIEQYTGIRAMYLLTGEGEKLGPRTSKIEPVAARSAHPNSGHLK